MRNGYCECGCGQQTVVATRNHTKYGWVKGQPVRFIRGHAMKGRTHTPEARRKSGLASKGVPKTEATKVKMRLAQLGANGNNWSGGRITREGRVLLYVGREHPMADSYGYVYEHRLVLAYHLGRMLRPEEHVHHLDENPLNNDVSNLIPLDRPEHTAVHNRIRKGDAPLDALRKVALGICD